MLFFFSFSEQMRISALWRNVEASLLAMMCFVCVSVCVGGCTDIGEQVARSKKEVSADCVTWL